MPSLLKRVTDTFRRKRGGFPSDSRFLASTGSRISDGAGELYKPRGAETSTPSDQNSSKLLTTSPLGPVHAMYPSRNTEPEGAEPKGDGESHPSRETTGLLPAGVLAHSPGKGFQRFKNVKGAWRVYYKDVFHTLLNMPAHRFLLLFFSAYLLEFFVFGLLYLSMPAGCVVGHMGFSHAMWFSVQTASTIGYSSGPTADPDCVVINLMIIFNIILAALVDFLLMGLVFARFASPMAYASTIRFSSHAVLHLANESDGEIFNAGGGWSSRLRPAPGQVWCLSFRLANIRKHSLLTPELSVMLALPA
eukprot:gene10180-8086_t